MRDDCSAAVGLSQFNAVKRFSECADLVDLNQNLIRDPQLDPFAEKGGVCNEEIVADKLHPLT